MRARRAGLLISAGLLASACTVSVDSGQATPVEPAAGADGGDVEGASAAPEPAPTTTLAIPATDTPAAPEPAPDEETTTTSSTTPPTTTEPAPEIYDEQCVVLIGPLDSLLSIVAAIDDETVNVVSLRAENDLPDADLIEGDYLDVCVDNGLNDVTGAQRTGPDEEVVATAIKQNVEIQQLKLNKLFTGLGTPELLVDGISGPVTRQRLCAARLAFGLPTSHEDMAAGSDEEDILLAADTLPIPFTTSILSDRWILIDRTCQIMFAGERDERLTFVFPTSTGSEGFETRNQDRSAAFRYDPAVDNGGWHDSTDFPSAADNPLNGNMYRPLYFDLGQAIHGANNVPRSPQSKGCARLRVSHQDALVTWIGLDDRQSPVWNANQIRVTVNVQGEFVPNPG